MFVYFETTTVGQRLSDIWVRFHCFDIEPTHTLYMLYMYGNNEQCQHFVKFNSVDVQRSD